MAKKKQKYRVRPDGLHETSFRVNGKRIWFRGKTDAEVDQKILAYNAEQEKAKEGRAFDVVADCWWDEIEPTLAWNTAKSYKPAKLRAVDQFGGYLCKDITAKDIDQYIKQFAKEGYARNTVVTQLQIIRQILNFAEVAGDITYNPATAVSPPRNLPKTRRLAPDKEQIKIIKDGITQPYGLFAFLVYYTGCRLGEALALQYQDIDFKNKTISISKSVYFMGAVPKIKEPKTDSGIRQVPLLEPLEAALDKNRRFGYIFSPDGGKTPYRKAQSENAWRAYCKEIGLAVTPHQIRHGYSSALFEAGIDPKIIQVLLGHAQLSTTMDIYTHIQQNQLQVAAGLALKTL